MREPLDAKPDIGAIGGYVDTLHQQLHDARLLGGEQLVRCGSSPSIASRACASVSTSISCLANRHVPTMISGVRNMPRTDQ
jgi:hypothetical protein